ncbi:MULTISPECIES: hypothetical protein [unclassified Pusillimonas]|uniref:hypothetical protein n=1 Tax=unclassified Pusillimonas TaxID=2640016 RepID=UPI000B9CA2FA|nr:MULTISPECIES: hypothetical protein [unclassified Pusillimonas]OXR49617.1 hypothetical protein PuT2_07485 [Pusillimonas sp. T2]ROT44951.1 hypothetical protein CHR62_08835 [Pusillimonas sp. NJUB218]
MTEQNKTTNPWWKEPWPWIIMAGPFLALVGCAITIALAVKHFSGEAITDGGVRQGLVVKRVGPDRTLQTPPAATQNDVRGKP